MQSRTRVVRDLAVLENLGKFHRFHPKSSEESKWQLQVPRSTKRLAQMLIQIAIRTVSLTTWKSPTSKQKKWCCWRVKYSILNQKKCMSHKHHNSAENEAHCQRVAITVLSHSQCIISQTSSISWDAHRRRRVTSSRASRALLTLITTTKVSFLGSRQTIGTIQRNRKELESWRDQSQQDQTFSHCSIKNSKNSFNQRKA